MDFLRARTPADHCAQGRCHPHHFVNANPAFDPCATALDAAKNNPAKLAKVLGNRMDSALFQIGSIIEFESYSAPTV